MSGTVERIVAFSPIPEGVTAHFVNRAGEWSIRPVVGWLTLDEYEADARGGALIDAEWCPRRRVVAGALDGHEVRPTDSFGNFWIITLPDDSGPTPDEIAERAAELQAAAASPEPGTAKEIS